MRIPAAIPRSLPDSKAGASTIPLNGTAPELLTNALRIEGNPNVIAGNKPIGPIMGVTVLLEMILSKPAHNTIPKGEVSTVPLSES